MRRLLPAQRSAWSRLSTSSPLPAGAAVPDACRGHDDHPPLELRPPVRHLLGHAHPRPAVRPTSRRRCAQGVGGPPPDAYADHHPIKVKVPQGVILFGEGGEGCGPARILSADRPALRRRPQGAVRAVQPPVLAHEHPHPQPPAGFAVPLLQVRPPGLCRVVPDRSPTAAVAVDKDGVACG